MGRWSKVGFSVRSIVGAFLCFLGASSIGVGGYFTIWYAMRPLYYRTMAFAPSGTDWIVFPLFFGLGGLLWVLGTLYLKGPDQAVVDALRILRKTK